jgi:large subunit ribosomal protein L3
MTIGLLGKKLGMTRLYDEAGTIVPVTVIQAGPCAVLQIKSRDRDGYNAVQLGYDPMPSRKANRPMSGHFKRAGVEPVRLVREFRIEDLNGFQLGQRLNLDLFEVGEKVDVTGVSKGRGFAGPQKRHNFSRGPETHGSNYHRKSGSRGASADPSHTLKGTKAPGRMGGERVTVQNLIVVRKDADQNLLVLRGAVPGHMGAYVMVRKKVRRMPAAHRKGARS